jgi:hypothetical protein
MGYPEVIHRQLWITFLADCIFYRARSRSFRRCKALANAQTTPSRTRTLKVGGTKIASLFLQAQLLLFSQNHFGNDRSRHRVKVFSEVIGAVRGVYETQISTTASPSSLGYPTCRSLQHAAGGGHQPGDSPRFRGK